MLCLLDHANFDNFQQNVKEKKRKKRREEKRREVDVRKGVYSFLTSYSNEPKIDKIQMEKSNKCILIKQIILFLMVYVVHKAFSEIKNEMF